MKCEICSEHEATVHLTEVRNNKARKINMCEQCAEQKGIKIVKGQPPGINIENILSGMMTPFEKTPANLPDIDCSNCGMTFKGFMNVKKFGCSECYSAFEAHLKVLFKNIHGSASHIGKLPAGKAKKAPAGKLLRQKQLELKAAVEEERYEDAARLRDEIKKLKTRKADAV